MNEFYTTTEVSNAISSYSWTDLSEQVDGYVTAIILRGEPLVVTKLAGKDGDYEDEGEQDVFVVVKVGNQFFKKSGYYYSHSGSEWSGTLKEVKAVTKTVTVYE